MEPRSAERPARRCPRTAGQFQPVAPGARSARTAGARDRRGHWTRPDIDVQATSDLAELAGLAAEWHATGELRCVLACGGDGTAAVVRNHTPLEVPLLAGAAGNRKPAGPVRGAIRPAGGRSSKRSTRASSSRSTWAGPRDATTALLSADDLAPDSTRKSSAGCTSVVAATSPACPMSNRRCGRFVVTNIRRCSYIATMTADGSRVASRSAAAGCLASTCRCTPAVGRSRPTPWRPTACSTCARSSAARSATSPGTCGT